MFKIYAKNFRIGYLKKHSRKRSSNIFLRPTNLAKTTTNVIQLTSENTIAGDELPISAT